MPGVFEKLRLSVIRSGSATTWRSQHGHSTRHDCSHDTSSEAATDPKRGLGLGPARLSPPSPRRGPTCRSPSCPPNSRPCWKLLPAGVTLPLEILGPMVLQRTPLANATLSLWAYSAETRRPRRDLREASGPQLRGHPHILHLRRADPRRLGLAQGQRPSELPAAPKSRATLPTCQEAVYGKLRRVPISLSLGFFEDAQPGTSGRSCPRVIRSPRSPRRSAA